MTLVSDNQFDRTRRKRNIWESGVRGGVDVKREHAFAIDLVRFLSALMVVGFHLGFYAWFSTASTTQAAFQHVATMPELRPFTWFGWVGVEIFFVISGYVISVSAQGVPARTFLEKRILRLVPAAWICSLVTLAVVLGMGQSDLASAARLTLRAAFFNPFEPWIDGAYWTLWVEIAFYGLVFLLVALKGFTRLHTVMTVVGLASAAFWLATLIPGHEGLAEMADHRRLQLSLLPFGLYFALGVEIFLSAERGPSWGRGLLMGVLLAAAMVEIRHASHGFDPEGPPLVPAIVFLAGFAAVAASAHGKSQVANWPGFWRAGIRLAGLATYPLYLVHNVVGASLERQLDVAGVNPDVSFLFVVLLMVVLSFGIAGAAEPKLRSFLREALGTIGLGSRRSPSGERHPA